jgi:hypothetical protein
MKNMPGQVKTTGDLTVCYAIDGPFRIFVNDDYDDLPNF